MTKRQIKNQLYNFPYTICAIKWFKINQVRPEMIIAIQEAATERRHFSVVHQYHII